MPAPLKPFDLNKALHQGEVKVEFQVKTAEDAEEKTLRLRKEYDSHIIKDLAPYVVAMLFVLAIGTYCFLALIRTGSTAEEKQRAWTALSTILAGVVGVVFGKALK